ncbi:hypothetical protein [Jeotgalibaca porci]|uniref:hypothetical protein n=1 Tax=Jeotgalibaca porci TaxID=1868793 RepID=UPI00359F494B
MPNIIVTRKVRPDFDIIEFLHSKGYLINRHFALHDRNINGWEVWTLHVPNPTSDKYDNYAIGLKGDKFVVLDSEGVVFRKEWIEKFLK